MAMRRMQTTLAGLALGTALMAGGCAEQSAESSVAKSPEIEGTTAQVSGGVNSPSNAATAYRRIDAAMGDAFFDQLANMSASGSPSPAESAYLKSKQSIVRDLIEASKLPTCDFGTDYSQGMNVMMPHLLWGRNFAMLLQYDAIRVLHEQHDGAAATERLAAILRISDDVGSEPVALAKLTSLANVEMALQTIVQSNALLTNARDREMLVNELRRVEAGPSFEFKAMLTREADMAKLSIQRGDSVSPGIAGTEIIVPADARVGTIAEIQRVLREIDKVWNLPRAEQEIKRNSDQVRLAMAKPFVTGYDALRKRSRDTQAKIQVTIKTLQAPPRK